MNIRIFFISALILISAAAFAGGNSELPEVPALTSGVQYLSPDGDGVQDTAILTFSATVNVKSKEGYIPEYSLTIIDEDGNILKEVVKEEKSDISWFVQIFTGYSQHKLTKSIEWDGLDKDGNAVKDGVYKVQLKVVAASKKETITDLDNFIVDTQVPIAVIEANSTFSRYKTFSPNGDGQKDYFIIDQSGSNEAVWTSEILDSDGKVIYTAAQNNQQPSVFSWNGKLTNGSEASDGTYLYRFHSTDQSGNVSEMYEITGIVLDRTVIVIEIAEDFQDPRNRAFSPNSDGIKDFLTITPTVPYQESVTSWVYTVMNSTITTEPIVYLQITGAADDIPKQIKLDGKDHEGNAIPESDLDFEFTVTYQNGNIAQVSLTQAGFNNLELDNTAPEITFLRGKENMERPFTIDILEAFSPNGDGKKDEARVVIKSNEDIDWSIKLYDETPKYIGTVDSTITTSVIVWDGTYSAGAVMADGIYSGKGTFTDYAGNVTFADRAVVIDTTPVTLDINYPDGFSPNGDGSGDSFIVSVVNADIPKDVAFWSLEFFDDASMIDPVYGVSGEELPESAQWDGKKLADGVVVPEGIYGFVFTVIYEKGDVIKKMDSLVVEYIMPNLTVDTLVSYRKNFEVTGTVDDPTATVSIEIDSRTFPAVVNGNSWSAEVTDMEDGVYNVAAEAVDPAGNIGVDYSDDEITVSASGPEINYAGSATNDTTPVISGTVDDSDASITVTVNGKTYKAVIDGNKWSAEVTEKLDPGKYDVIITAENSKGEKSIYDEKDGLLVDVVPPVITVVVTKNPFTKTSGGIEGDLYVTIKAYDDNEVSSWTMDIVEKGKKLTPENTVRSYAGDGDPSDKIVWKGETDDSVQAKFMEEFTLIVTVTDIGGNKTVYDEDIKLDVIVIKRDGKLYLMVPNIIFGAYKDTLNSRGTAMTKRNYNSLEKVVGIFNKYPLFGLGLEAHALNIFTSGSEKWELEEQVLLPLTERRAETVQKALEALGLTSSIIVTNAYGGVYPIASTTDHKEWWKNRRVEFIMIPPSGSSEGEETE